jgi:predicted tellurium resistance membrane protein TerC
MDKSKYLLISSCIFGLVAALHLFRVLRSLSLTIGSWTLPIWASVFAFVVLSLLSYRGITLWRRDAS